MEKNNQPEVKEELHGSEMEQEEIEYHLPTTGEYEYERIFAHYEAAVSSKEQQRIESINTLQKQSADYEAKIAQLKKKWRQERRDWQNAVVDDLTEKYTDSLAPSDVTASSARVVVEAAREDIHASLDATMSKLFATFLEKTSHEDHGPPLKRPRLSTPTEAWKKDPNVPRPDLSAYNFFGHCRRGKIRQNNRGIGWNDVSKKLGEEWRALSNEEKAQYGARAAAEGKLYEELKAHHEAKAAADKKRYEEEMAIYEAKEAADKKRDEDDQKATSTAVRIIAGFMDEWKAANTPGYYNHEDYDSEYSEYEW